MTNEMNMENPLPWLNTTLIQHFLHRDNPTETIEIVDFSVDMLPSSVRHYGSDLFRSTVNYLINGKNVRELRLIIKVESENPWSKSLLYDYGCFPRESEVYKMVLPQVERILLQSSDHTKLAPKCFEMNRKPAYLIVEDLGPQGYQMLAQDIGLDYTHLKLLLTKIAKLHAATACLATQNVSFKSFDRHVMEYQPGWEQVVTDIVRACTEAIETDPTMEYWHNKLSKLLDSFYDKLKAAITRDENGFNVFCHGDLWKNNMLFKYNENGVPIDVIIIDYQMPYWGPPILDIVNVLYSSFDGDLQELDVDLLLRYYHTELSENLIRLNYSKTIPTLVYLHNEFQKRAFFYVPFRLMGVKPIESIADDDHQEDKNEEANDEDSHESKASLKRMFENLQYRQDLLLALQYFDEKGFLDR